MSKIATVLIGGGGTAAVAVGGTLLFKNGFGQGETPEVSLLFNSVSEFETGGKDEKSKCVNGFFAEGFAESDERTSAPDNLTGATSFFSTSTDAQNTDKSCVIIDWKKENYTGDKGTGKFTGTGTFVKGNEGFVNFNVAETISGDTNKLKFTGVFYLLGKEGSDTPKGKVKHRKEIKNDTDSKKIGQNDLVDYFPKRGTGIAESDVADSYGGFFKNNAASGQELQNVCGTNDCTDANKQPTSSKRIDLSGTGAQAPSSGNDSRTALKSGSENLTGGDSIYGASPWSLKGKLVDSFKGHWSKVTAQNNT